MLTLAGWSCLAHAFLQIPSAVPAAPASFEPLPLIVEHAEIAPADPLTGRPDGIEFTIYNGGLKTIEAWGVRVVVTLEDGHVSNGGLSTDMYSSPGDPERDRGPLRAASRRTEYTTYSRPIGRNPQVVSIDVEPSFVILDDNTAAGDERQIELFFHDRALDQRAWPVIENVVAAVVAAGGDPADVLLDIRTSLARVKDDNVRASQAYRWLDRSLEMNLKIPQLDHAAYLQRILQDIRARRAKADAHYRRRR